VDGNCRQASSPNAICNCPLATAGSPRKPRPKNNGTSNKAAHYDNPAANTADASIASGEAATAARLRNDPLTARNSPIALLAHLLQVGLERVDDVAVTGGAFLELPEAPSVPVKRYMERSSAAVHRPQNLSGPRQRRLAAGIAADLQPLHTVPCC